MTIPVKIHKGVQFARLGGIDCYASGGAPDKYARQGYAVLVVAISIGVIAIGQVGRRSSGALTVRIAVNGSAQLEAQDRIVACTVIERHRRQRVGAIAPIHLVVVDGAGLRRARGGNASRGPGDGAEGHGEGFVGFDFEVAVDQHGDCFGFTGSTGKAQCRTIVVHIIVVGRGSGSVIGAIRHSKAPLNRVVQGGGKTTRRGAGVAFIGRTATAEGHCGSIVVGDGAGAGTGAQTYISATGSQGAYGCVVHLISFYFRVVYDGNVYRLGSNCPGSKGDCLGGNACIIIISSSCRTIGGGELHRDRDIYRIGDCHTEGLRCGRFRLADISRYGHSGSIVILDGTGLWRTGSSHTRRCGCDRA